MFRGFVSMSATATQRHIAQEFLAARGIVRLAELRKEGVTAATISRMERAGEVLRLTRGLYKLPDAPLDVHHSLAEAAKRVPKGVVCLVSALAFHGLTDQMPKHVWIAMGQKDWAPSTEGPHMQIVRFSDRHLTTSVKTQVIEGVLVKVFGVAKTVADCFRYRNKIGLSIAIEGLREALRQRKATPADIAQLATTGGVSTIVRPYLEALTANG
jgi:predicted transcriptional regulator of viral defense system